jgi:hypothetical protein
MTQGLRQAFFLDLLEKSAYGARLAPTERYVFQELAKDSAGAPIRIRLMPAPS